MRAKRNLSLRDRARTLAKNPVTVQRKRLAIAESRIGVEKIRFLAPPADGRK
jgi:hypothetical protein